MHACSGPKECPCIFFWDGILEPCPREWSSLLHKPCMSMGSLSALYAQDRKALNWRPKASWTPKGGGNVPADGGSKATLRRSVIREVFSFPLFFPPPNGVSCPKDPVVLKILRRSKFTLRSKFTMAQWFTMAAHLARTSFPCFYRHLSSQRRVRSIVNMGGVVKTLRRSNSLSRSVLVWWGPLGDWSTQR